jgi:hypothetical protein
LLRRISRVDDEANDGVPHHRGKSRSDLFGYPSILSNKVIVVNIPFAISVNSILATPITRESIRDKGGDRWALF